MTESSDVLYGEYSGSGYIPMLSLVLPLSTLCAQSCTSLWAQCPKAQVLFLNLDLVVSMLWEFMLVNTVKAPSSLCFEKGGDLAGECRHSDERSQCEREIREQTEKENVTQHQHLG